MTATPNRRDGSTPTSTSATRCSSTRSPRASRTASSRRTGSAGSCSAPTRTAGRPTAGPARPVRQGDPGGPVHDEGLRAGRLAAHPHRGRRSHLTEYLKRTDRWAKTIVFCVNQEHADQMRRALHNANADLTKQHPELRRAHRQRRGRDRHAATSATSPTPRRTLPVIATTSQMLSTGVDLPTVRNIVLFRPSGRWRCSSR